MMKMEITEVRVKLVKPEQPLPDEVMPCAFCCFKDSSCVNAECGSGDSYFVLVEWERKRTEYGECK